MNFWTPNRPLLIDTGARAFEALVKGNSRPTAVLCANDVLAAGALRAARELDLSVPKDISVTGFDDIELSIVVHPALTTVHVPHRDMGRKAARVLVAMIQDTPPENSVELPVEIKLRTSLGSAPD